MSGHRLGAAILVGLALFLGGDCAEADRVSGSETEQTLACGASFRRPLASKEAHRYRLPLSRGQYVHFVVEQLGIDVELSVLGPNGLKLMTMDMPTGASGPEEVSWIAETDADYGLLVQAFDSPGPGEYELLVKGCRPSTDADRERLLAEAALVQGYQLQDSDPAETQQKCVTRLESAVEAWRNLREPRLEEMTLYLLARAHFLLNDYRRSVDVHQSALKLSRSAGDRAGIARNLCGLGNAEHRIQAKQDALRHFEEALRLERELGDRYMESEVLASLADLYDSLGEKQRAIEQYRQNLPLMREAGNRVGEYRTLASLGYAYTFQGEKEKALEAYRQALEICRALGDRKSEAIFLGNIGHVYLGLGEIERGTGYLNEGLSTVRELGDRLAEATMLVGLGRSLAAAGEPAKAVAVYSRSLPLFQELQDKQHEANTLNFLAAAYAELKEPEASRRASEEALSVARAATDPYQEGIALTNLGIAVGALGDREKALEYLRRAMPLRRAVDDRFGQLDTLFAMARLEQERGASDSALGHAREGLDVADSLRDALMSQDLRTSFFATIQKHYAFVVDLLMTMHGRMPERGWDAEALQVSERARARSLIDLISEAGAAIAESADPALFERARTLRRMIGLRIDGQWRRSGNEDAEKTRPSDVERLRADYEEVEARIRQTNPRYASLTRPRPLTLTEIQQVLDDDTLLLEFFLGPDRSLLWAVTPSSLTSHVLPPRGRIEDATRRLHGLLTARATLFEKESPAERSSRLTRADSDGSRAALELSRMLLAGVREIPERRRVVIVGDGALLYLPFALLSSPDGEKPLLADHEVVMLPSASVVSLLRRDLEVRRPPAGLLAVLADPVFDRSDARVRGGPSAFHTASSDARILRSAADVGLGDGKALRLARLPFTRREAQAILNLVPADRRKSALDFEASRETATSAELAHYRFVHFATHGFLDSAHPELSGLVLSLVDREGREQPGFLSAGEIYGLTLPADLVVLSGCQTALGKEIRGEGLVGLTRGFMYAGAARVLASLWKIDDVATADLMRRFYGGMLKEHLSPAAALRAAQISVRNEKRWQAPYYWAGFMLQGEWK